jgi:hypothetical protein
MNYLEKVKRVWEIRKKLLYGEIGLFDAYTEIIRTVYGCKSELATAKPPREDDKKP